MPKNEPWDSETAREAALRSAEVRRRKAEVPPQQRAEEACADDEPRLVRELLDAAHGRGDFEGLNKDLRLKALIRALEYGLGRPSTTKVPAGESANGTGPTPDDLFA